ncbi:MAG: hypothetical protein R8K47_01015 [Mariprofundaceae bacterium]
MPLSVLLVLASFAVMALAWVLRRRHAVWHGTLMGVVMLFDLGFPVWLALTHDWYRRLIDEGELFSFLIWAHVILDLILYALYALQVLEGRRLMADRREAKARSAHRAQAAGIVVVRFFVFVSGALLIEPAAG